MKSFPMLILVYMCFLKLPIEYRNYLLIVTIGFAKSKRQQYEWQKDAQISTVFWQIESQRKPLLMLLLNQAIAGRKA